jgi:hypothetical protein
VDAVGTHVDHLRRAKARIDDTFRQLSVERAREAIFKFGRVVGGTAVNALLQARSWVPTRVSPLIFIHNGGLILKQNAFSERLFKHGLDYHTMLMPDLLHEFGLGVWKAVFMHLIRVLFSLGDHLVAELDARCVLC